jgi:hypothetical protein
MMRHAAVTAIAIVISLDAANAEDAVPVTPDNFVRAESDLYFTNITRDEGFARFRHHRELSPVDRQLVIRTNRDTLYSAAVFDLEAGPVTVTLPDAGKRFISMQVINQDEYTVQVAYKPAAYTLSKDQVGTRYVLVGVRMLVDPNDPADLKIAHGLQDAITAEQSAAGSFETPQWDLKSQSAVRKSLLELAATLPDTNRMFGTKDEIDPVRHLIGAASAWGGNPLKDAIYLNFTPEKNDGKTTYTTDVKDVPADGFWSVSVYNAQGYYQPNKLNAYTLNNVTARKSGDGSVHIQFGGCNGKVENCLPITKGWNYMVRLYRPRPEAADGTWTFPAATPTP